MASIDSYLTSLGLDLEDLLVQYDQNGDGQIDAEFTDEIYNLILDKYAEQTTDEAKSEFATQLQAELQELEAYLSGLIRQTENTKEAYEGQNNATKVAEAERYIQDLNEMLDMITAMDSSLNNAIKYDALIYDEADGDYSFSYDTNEWDEFRDGEVITIVATGDSGKGIFDNYDDGVSTDHLADTDGDGIGDTVIDANKDGVADFDVDGDGDIDYDDLNVNTANRDPSSGQSFYFNLNSGDTVSLASYDSESQTATFKVTREDGTSFFVTIQGDFNIKFYGDGNYISPEQILETFPEELAMRCFDGGDMLSWYKHLYQEDVSVADRVDAIPGYQNVTKNLESVFSTLNTYLSESEEFDYSKTGELSAANQQTVQDIIELLYSTLDSATELTTEEAWQQIYQMVEGLSEADKAAVLGAVIYAVAAYDSERMTEFFYAQSENLEKIIQWANYDAKGSGTNITAFDKFITMILEATVGSVNYPDGFWQTVFSADGTTSGTWNDQSENAVAFEWLEALASLTGTPISADIAAAKNNDAAVAKAEEKKETGDYKKTDEFSITDDEKQNIKNAVMSSDAKSGFDGISQENYEASIHDLIDLLDEGVSFEELASQILAYLDDLKNNWDGDVAAGFIYYLNQYRPDLIEGLMEVDGFSDAIIEMIKKEKHRPEKQKEALEILS